jgi:GNAT superfamily N-acetyltransferase
MGCETSLTLGGPGDVVVEEIDETTLGDFLATALLGWSVPREQAELERAVHLRALAERPRVAQFFAARADGVCLGTAGLLMRDGYGYLVGTQVLESARGRGIYRTLVGARLAFLRARGLGFAVTHAREATSAPMLEHLGFETLFRSRCFVLDPPSRTSAP